MKVLAPGSSFWVVAIALFGCGSKPAHHRAARAPRDLATSKSSDSFAGDRPGNDGRRNVYPTKGEVLKSESIPLTKIDAALARAVSRFDSPEALFSDQLWFLMRAQEKISNTDLGELIARFRMRIRNDGMTALIEPAWEQHPPPTTGPVAWRTLIELMRDSTRCRAGQAPSQKLRSFIAEDHSGYILTHQILAMLWAESVGCTPPIEWHARKEELVHRVLHEIEADAGTNLDLFVERLAVVALAGYVDELRSDWVERILAAQRYDGFWQTPDETITMSFRGYTLVSEGGDSDPTHCSSMALCVLAYYRELVLR
ncbi:MAG: DUF4735 domain-containing protein [Planctomycetes bacterium]|nr:DUF4735 domain-containing protein [Planctomycetota bacterium]